MMTAFLKPKTDKSDTLTKMTDDKVGIGGLTKVTPTIDNVTKNIHTSYEQAQPLRAILTDEEGNGAFSYIFRENPVSNPVKEVQPEASSRLPVSNPVKPKYDSKAIRRLIARTAFKQGIPSFGSWG